MDVQVAIHTDTLNESGFVEATIAAFKGRTIHTYHTEGAGGGHAPDIIRVCGEGNVPPSSTNPTRPHMMTERGAVLRGGDCLMSEDGRVVRLAAAPKKLMHIVCANPFELTRAAYHLGNRHVPVEIGDGYLRIAAERVLLDMLLGLGAKVEEMLAPFEPESGAYGGGHGHHEEEAHDGKIHQYGEPGHGHEY